MHLSPKELDRLQLFLAAELARSGGTRGLRLNYPEALRAHRRRDLRGSARRQVRRRADGVRRRLLTTDDVLPGVAS